MHLRLPIEPTSTDRCRQNENGPAGYYNIDPPDELMASLPASGGRHPISNNRLSNEFRRALRANINSPLNLIVMATIERLNNNSPAGRIRSNAFADLAITGARVYANLYASGDKLESDELVRIVRQRVSPNFSEAQIARAVQSVTTRAVRVSWSLRGWGVRQRLGYIAVSAEDDSPDLPVNVPGPSLRANPLIDQYFLDVNVSPTRNIRTSLQVRIRFAIFGNREEVTQGNRQNSVNAFVTCGLLAPRSIPITIHPDRDILLFIHGHSSRLEEAIDLAPSLISQGYQILALDLPGFGYSTHINPNAIGRIASDRNVERIATEGPNRALEFLEQSIVDFMDELESLRQGTKARIKGVIGGSLGGNLGLRLAQRGLRDLNYLHTVVTWSPASVWGSSWARARLIPFIPGIHVDVKKHEAVRVSRDRALERETTRIRYNYISQVFGHFQALEGRQADRWFRENWNPCKENYIEGARFDREEIYTEAFRKWHWRVAHEQLIFMHDEKTSVNGHPRLRDVQSRVLIGAGSEDNHGPDKLWDHSRHLAIRMINTAGSTMWLKNTGHSIHNERPVQLAREIVKFVPNRRTTTGENWEGWTQIGDRRFHPNSINAHLLNNGAMELYGIDRTNNRLYYTKGQRINEYRFNDWRVISEGTSGVTFKGRPAVAQLDNGKLRMYALRADKDWITHLTQQSTDGSWKGTDMGNIFRQLIGGAATSPAVLSRVGKDFQLLAQDNPMRLHLVAAGRSSGFVHIRGQQSTGYPDGYWPKGRDLGGALFFKTPFISRNQDGRLEIFNVDINGRVMHCWETSSDNWRSSWSHLNGGWASGGCAVVRHRDGRLFAFVVGTSSNRNLYYCHQVRPNSGWTTWSSLGGSMAVGATPTCIVDFQGDILVAVRRNDNKVGLRRLRLLSNSWSRWNTLDGTVAGDPVAVASYNGGIALLAISTDGLCKITSLRS